MRKGDGMSTSYETIYNSFFDRVEKDDTFVDYINLTDVECMELAQKRAHAYLIEAISELTSKCTPDINFKDYDDDLEVINEDLTVNEINLLADIMFKIYMARDIPKLHVFSLNFTPSEMNVFSPANERKTYIELIEKLQADVDRAIDNYVSTDRITGKRKGINYDAYAEY